MAASGRLLLVQPSLQPPGGGNAVAAWMIQALAGRHHVSVLTWRPIRLDAVNAYYGTAIEPDDITPLEVPAAIRRPLDLLPTPSTLLKNSFVFRYAKRIAGAYDVVLCGANETDLGPRCIQYVHYPARLRPRPRVDLRWYHHVAPPLLRAYYAVCDRLAALDAPRVLEATTLANSTWTADLLRDLYGADGVRVLHPPVAADGHGRPWSEREDGFVCIGRIAPEKELERIVTILARVRGEMPDAHLHIIGSRGPGWYSRKIRRLASEHPWIQLHEDVSRRELFDLIGAHRFGIHGMAEEHFGIAPAEAVAGGCIVFVPAGGGQVDIIGAEPRLLYESAEDAVGKILQVMRTPADQDALREHLAVRQALFSRERFVSEIRCLVDEALDRRGALS